MIFFFVDLVECIIVLQIKMCLPACFFCEGGGSISMWLIYR